MDDVEAEPLGSGIGFGEVRNGVLLQDCIVAARFLGV